MKVKVKAKVLVRDFLNYGLCFAGEVTEQSSSWSTSVGLVRPFGYGILKQTKC